MCAWTSYDKISLEARCSQVGLDVPGTIQWSSTQPMTSRPNNAPTLLCSKGASIQSEGRAALLRRHSSLLSPATRSGAPFQPDPPVSGAGVNEQQHRARRHAQRQTRLESGRIFRNAQIEQSLLRVSPRATLNQLLHRQIVWVTAWIRWPRMVRSVAGYTRMGDPPVAHPPMG